MSGYWEAKEPTDVVKIPEDFDHNEDCCPDYETTSGWYCIRAIGHKGRHMAYAGVDHVIAAWPGTHTPTSADLEAIP